MKFPITFALFFLFPTALFAANAGDSIFTLQGVIFAFFARLGVLFFAGSVAFFVYGIVKFIKNAEDSKEREQAKNFILWAIIAFTVLVSLWGIVRFFGDTLGVTMGGDLKLGDKDGNILN